MKYYGKAEQSASEILAAFQSGSMPKALAQVFIHRRDSVPCRAWSCNNQLLVALHGYTEARGFRQWQEVGRSVKAGEKALFILAPLTALKTETDKATGNEVKRPVIFGFKSLPVFGFEQTEGEPLPQGDPEIERWIASLPLLEVARSWGLSIQAYSGKAGKVLGGYSLGKGIYVGVKNLSTWAHELIHAADDKNGNLVEKGQQWCSEVVAELGGAILLECLGLTVESDRGGCWEYVTTYATKAGIEPISACMLVIERTCQAVARVLDEAEKLAGSQTQAPGEAEEVTHAA